MANALRLTLALVVFLEAGAAFASDGDDPWESYRFLIGAWVGEGGGRPGVGAGRFTFGLDLQKKVLVRRGRLDLPGTSPKAPPPHEDLMVIYRGEGGDGTRAIYFDSEGHTILYRASFSADKQTLTFLSDPVPGSPRFRLSYTKGKGETVRITFEIAPPGKPDGFKVYLEGDARRTGSGR